MASTYKTLGPQDEHIRKMLERVKERIMADNEIRQCRNDRIRRMEAFMDGSVQGLVPGDGFARIVEAGGAGHGLDKAGYDSGTMRYWGGWRYEKDDQGNNVYRRIPGQKETDKDYTPIVEWNAAEQFLQSLYPLLRPGNPKASIDVKGTTYEADNNAVQKMSDDLHSIQEQGFLRDEVDIAIKEAVYFGDACVGILEVKGEASGTREIIYENIPNDMIFFHPSKKWIGIGRETWYGEGGIPTELEKALWGSIEEEDKVGCSAIYMELHDTQKRKTYYLYMGGNCLALEAKFVGIESNENLIIIEDWDPATTGIPYEFFSMGLKLKGTRYHTGLVYSWVGLHEQAVVALSRYYDKSYESGESIIFTMIDDDKLDQLVRDRASKVVRLSEFISKASLPPGSTGKISDLIDQWVPFADCEKYFACFQRAYQLIQELQRYPAISRGLSSPAVHNAKAGTAATMNSSRTSMVEDLARIMARFYEKVIRLTLNFMRWNQDTLTCIERYQVNTEMLMNDNKISVNIDDVKSKAEDQDKGAIVTMMQSSTQFLQMLMERAQTIDPLLDIQKTYDNFAKAFDFPSVELVMMEPAVADPAQGGPGAGGGQGGAGPRAIGVYNIYKNAGYTDADIKVLANLGLGGPELAQLEAAIMALQGDTAEQSNFMEHILEVAASSQSPAEFMAKIFGVPEPAQQGKA